jgi:6,7-dimethyl-8-ribityllumazine synthase
MLRNRAPGSTACPVLCLPVQFRPLAANPGLNVPLPGKTIEGNHDATGMRFAIVAGRFNDFLVQPLVEAALDAIEKHGGDVSGTTLAWVPGAFEIPLAARRMAETRNYDAVICLGAVVRGDTPHFEFVAGECAAGIARNALQTGVPCIFGVLTTDNLEQAIARAGGESGNKGTEAALAAIEMASLLKSM